MPWEHMTRHDGLEQENIGLEGLNNIVKEKDKF